MVGGLATGSGFSRGNGNVGGGNVISTPSMGCEVMGQVVRSWLIRAWAQPRAALEMSAAVGAWGSGLASLQRRLPRSNV